MLQVAVGPFDVQGFSMFRVEMVDSTSVWLLLGIVGPLDRLHLPGGCLIGRVRIRSPLRGRVRFLGGGIRTWQTKQNNIQDIAIRKK